MGNETIYRVPASHKRRSVRYLLVYPVTAPAQIIGDIEANIPFAFHAGSAKLPAGQYRIHALEDSDLTVMEITNAAGSTSVLFQVQDAEADTTPAKSELVFNKSGNRYFLAKLFQEGSPRGSQVLASRYEKRIAEQSKEGLEHVPVSPDLRRTPRLIKRYVNGQRKDVKLNSVRAKMLLSGESPQA